MALDGRIKVALVPGRGHATLTIDDSAPGVPDGAHQRIFERLYRADQARGKTGGAGGSGLGLAICQALLAAHGGAIEAAPSPLGGLALSIRLPLLTATPP